MNEYTRCNQFDTPCRFCSQETLTVPYAPLIEDPKSKRLIPGSVAHRIEPLGTWCNNISRWCKDVVQCPARLALAYEPWTGCKAHGTGIYASLRWKVREDGDVMRTQEIVHFGQQVLEI